MAELRKTRRLSIAASIFVLILVIGLLTFRKPTFNYSVSSEEFVKQLGVKSWWLSPEESRQVLNSENSDCVLIDLRNPEEFDKGHLENAVNIPVSEILANSSFEVINNTKKTSKSIILIGNDLLVTNGIWMLLKQVGIVNIKMIPEFDFQETVNNKTAENYIRVRESEIEKPSFNFAQLMKSDLKESQNSSSTSEKNKQILPTKKVKKTSTQGGC